MNRLPLPLVPRPLRYGGALAVAGVIAYFSLVGTATPPGPDVPSFWDKRLHVAAYAGLALALAYASAPAAPEGWSTDRVVAVVALALGYGLAMELVQWPLSGRYFSLWDLLANAVGASVALVWLVAERWVRYVPVPRR